MEDKLLSTTKSSSISSEATIELPDWLYHGSTVAIIPELFKHRRFEKKGLKRLEVFDDVSKFLASPALSNDRTYQSLVPGGQSVLYNPPFSFRYNLTVAKDMVNLDLTNNSLHLTYYLPVKGEAVGIRAGTVSPLPTCTIEVSSDPTNSFANYVSLPITVLIAQSLPDRWTNFSVSGKRFSTGTVVGTGANLTAIRWIRFRWQLASVFIGSKIVFGALDAVPLPAKGKVIFTFDDNWLCQYSVVAPILAKYNYPAVVFPSPFAQRTLTGQVGSFTCNASATANLVIASSGNLSVGAPVTGNNIVAGTYVLDINGTAVTLSQAPTASITSFNVPVYMSVDQMLHLQNVLGWQIATQDFNMDGTTYMTKEQWLIESAKNKIAQAACGFHGGADWSAYGGKRYSPNAEVFETAKRLYRSSRLFFNGGNQTPPMFTETYPFGDPFSLRCMNYSSGFVPGTVAARIQDLVQSAIDYKDVAIFGEHSGINSFTTENGVALASLVEYIRTQELLGLVEVVTFNSLANSQ